MEQFSLRNTLDTETQAIKGPSRFATRARKYDKAIEAERAAREVRQTKQAVKRSLQSKRTTAKVEAAAPDIQRASGSHDRTTYSAEIVDARLFLEALIGGKHGIPLDTVQPNQVALNLYAQEVPRRAGVAWDQGAEDHNDCLGDCEPWLTSNTAN